MRCYKCKVDISPDELGIYDHSQYYGYWNNLDLTVGHYSELDRKVLSERALISCPRVLLAGCACDRSVWEFAGLFSKGTEISIVDLNDDHFPKIIEQTRQWRPEIFPYLRFIKGDLKDITGEFSYIRMDFTPNCMPRTAILPVLVNLKSCLAPGGVIASTVEESRYPCLICNRGLHSMPLIWDESKELFSQADIQVKWEKNIFAWRDHPTIDEFGCDDIERTEDLIGSFYVLQ